MRRALIGAVIASMALMAGCHQQPQQVAYDPAPVVQQAPQYAQQAPVIVQQQSDNTGALVDGMILGHMMSGGGHTTVVHHYYAPRPVYVRRTYVYRRR